MFLITLLLSTSLGFAAENLDAAEHSRIRNKCNSESINNPLISEARAKELKDLCFIINKTAAKSVGLRHVNAALASKSKSCKVVVKSFGGTASYTASAQFKEEDAQNCLTEINGKQFELAESQNEIATNEDLYQTVSDKYDKLLEETQDAAAKKAIRETKSDFMGIRMSIYDAKLNNSESALILNKISQAVDNSVLGLYLRDRMAGLLNSDIMCESVKKCPGKRNVFGKQLDSVFNSKVNTKTTELTGVKENSAKPDSPTKEASKEASKK